MKNLADYVVHSRINRLFTLSESSIDLDFGDMNGIRSSFIKVDISMFGEGFYELLLLIYLLVEFSSVSFAQCSNFVEIF